MTIDDHSRIYQAAYEAINELSRSYALHGKFQGSHEGYAVLLEELDELWDEVKNKKRDIPAMRKECIQIAAMALKFCVDICDTGNER
jgi:hypothetical protein